MKHKYKMFVVSGVVQGVGFRYYTSQKGLQLGLKGYAKNLPDGRVEVLVCGEPEDVELMGKWLIKGPVTARVDSLDMEDIDSRVIYRGFEIL
ncbi:acylphosphatase [Vibrio sp. T187]|uniref:acylphosphatase n=1 Tax=Vibrio TaxID=662 RepID=UPI0010CA02C9|nr:MULTISPECIES: acylphosphatase [Vibrio]MBW3696982.1 acylphosphatase [Vibrio sp. T187]